MRNTNETLYSNDAENNNTALIYIATVSALCSVMLLLGCVWLLTLKKSEEKTSTAENQNRITSSNAVAIRIEQELSSNHRPGL
jgi:hypothetical protein